VVAHKPEAPTIARDLGAALAGLPFGGA